MGQKTGDQAGTEEVPKLLIHSNAVGRVAASGVGDFVLSEIKLTARV